MNAAYLFTFDVDTSAFDDGDALLEQGAHGWSPRVERMTFRPDGESVAVLVRIGRTGRLFKGRPCSTPAQLALLFGLTAR
jgi:hypothetical protein